MDFRVCLLLSLHGLKLTIPLTDLVRMPVTSAEAVWYNTIMKHISFEYSTGMWVRRSFEDSSLSLVISEDSSSSSSGPSGRMVDDAEMLRC